MPAGNRGRLATVPALVTGVVNTITSKRNESVVSLQDRMQTSSQWLDEAISSAKRKIVDGTNVSIQESKKPKTVAFKQKDLSPTLSSVEDKENQQQEVQHETKQQHVRIKPPPSAVKRKVNGMRVVDLRKELKSKGIETKGLKKDLQERLLQAYTTVEKFMSPPKEGARPLDQEVDCSQNEQKQELNIPDTESVEMIVFEAPAKIEKENISKLESMECETAKPSNSLQDDKSPMGLDQKEPGKMEYEASSSQSFREPQLMEVTNSGKKTAGTENQSRNNNAQDFRALQAHSASQKDEDQNQSSVIINESGIAQISDDTKATALLDFPTSSNAISSNGISQSSREESQEVHMSNDCVSKKSNLSDSEKAPVGSFHKRSGGSNGKGQATSPMKQRVQAAIQKFTPSKSPAVARANMTPSKLPWLNKSIASVPKLQSVSEETKKEKEESFRLKPEVVSSKKSGKPMLSAAAVSSTYASAIKSKFLTGNANSALSSSAQATNEARKARLAEIRGKNKQGANKPALLSAKTDAATKDFSASLSALKAKTTALTEEKDKRKLLAAQMREKAAARKLQENAGRDPGVSNNHSSGAKEVSKLGNDSNPIAARNGVTKDAMFLPHASATLDLPMENAAVPQAPQSFKSAARTPTGTSNHKMKSQEQHQILSPLDTYEISDREDSESESESEYDSDDEGKERKKIPDWAQRDKLIPALEKQFAEGNDRCDPDEIFAEVQTCDLEAIFNNKRTRYIKRTSSGNWSRDRVTDAEKLTYKRTMGFAGKAR